jgi:DNA-binding beta-propeller fold protein YncE
MGRLRAQGSAFSYASLLAALIAVSLGISPPVSAAATEGASPLGALSQLAPPYSCVSEEEAQLVEGCGTLVPSGLNDAYQAVVSPDGRNVYSVALAGALVEYSRNLANGALTPIGCVTSGVGPCAPSHASVNAPAMASPAAIAISADGKSAYVVTQGSANAIVEFSRDPESGLLTETGCVSEEPVAGCSAGARGLGSPQGVTVSPDGKNVYVTSYEDAAVAEFGRNTETGELTQLPWPNGCIGDAWGSGCGTVIWGHELERPAGVIVSPRGGNVYVAAGGAEGGGAIVAFWRDRETGALHALWGRHACISEVLPECSPGTQIDSPRDLVVSPDGKNLYASSYANNAVVELSRGRAGALRQLAAPDACVMNEPPAAACTAAAFIGSPLGIAISPDGGNLYVSSTGQAAEAAFERSPESGALQQLQRPYECLTSLPSGCAESGLTGLGGARATAVSPDGTNLYVAAQSAHTIVELARATLPTVSSISPSSGSEAGDTTVTITGSGFAEGDGVSFGANPAPSVKVISASSITATSPPGAGTNLDVRVASRVGSSAPVTADQFTYTTPLPPTVTAVSPERGPAAGGTVVTITGSEFVPGASVYFGASAASNVTVHSASLITATAPPGSGTVDVMVRTPSGTSPAASGDHFSYPEVRPAPAREPSSVIGFTSAASTSSGPSPPAQPPVLGESAIVEPVAGVVLIRLPGTRSFVTLTAIRRIPFGTVVDATRGRVDLTTAAPHRGTQTGEFFAGELIPTQKHSGVAIATLSGGNFSVCGRHLRAGRELGARASSGRAAGKHVVRKLWANAHGSFSTKGNYAAGAVQGTEWLTEDLCEGTLIKVTRDKVEVTDLVRHRQILVRAGHQYLARA